MTEPRRRSSRRRSVRGRGTGSITAYDTKAGTRWRFQVNVPVDVARPEIGDRKHSRAGFTSYEAADAELTLLRADLMRQVPQPRGRDTFAAYGQRWLDGHAVGNGTRMYIQRVLDAMDPYIGPVPMADIRATDLAAAYRGLENGTRQRPSPKRRAMGLATSTVARYANWVNTIFLAALDEGIVARSPANSKHSGRPRGETAKRVKPCVIWNVEQLTSFCDWALADDEPWARAWILLSRTGLLRTAGAHREHARPGPGGDEQCVVGEAGAVLQDDGAVVGVQRGGPGSEHRRAHIVRYGELHGGELGVGLQQGRVHRGPVVRRAGLPVDQGQVAPMSELPQLDRGGGAGGSGADDDHPWGSHDGSRP